MSRCPMFVVMVNVKTAKTDVNSDVYGDACSAGDAKANCGNCGRWDKEAGRCRGEQELVGGKN